MRLHVGWFGAYVIPAGLQVLAQPDVVATFLVWGSIVHHVSNHAEDVVVEDDDVGLR